MSIFKYNIENNNNYQSYNGKINFSPINSIHQIESNQNKRYKSPKRNTLHLKSEQFNLNLNLNDISNNSKLKMSSRRQKSQRTNFDSIDQCLTNKFSSPDKETFKDFIDKKRRELYPTEILIKRDNDQMNQSQSTSMKLKNSSMPFN